MLAITFKRLLLLKLGKTGINHQQNKGLPSWNLLFSGGRHYYNKHVNYIACENVIIDMGKYRGGWGGKSGNQFE